MDDFKYNDILHLPHHVSKTRGHMSMVNRGAQFAPFAALTGYGEAIDETARLTDSRIELDEDEKAVVNEKLQMIYERLFEKPRVRMTYFEPDERKSGGAYITTEESIKNIDTITRQILTVSRKTVPIDDLLDITIL